MTAAYLVVTIVAALANGYAAAVDLGRAEWAVANAVRVGATRAWLLPLGVLKAAGAVGLLAGTMAPTLGIAAASGLVLFFVGAFVAHLRVAWYSTLPYPGAFLALAVAALWLRLATL